MLVEIEQAIESAIDDGVLPEQFRDLDALEQVQAMITALAVINRDTEIGVDYRYRSFAELETSAYRWTPKAQDDPALDALINHEIMAGEIVFSDFDGQDDE